jgi:hypothetical protein
VGCAHQKRECPLDPVISQMTGSLCLCYCKTLLINAVECLTYRESRKQPNLSPQNKLFSLLMKRRISIVFLANGTLAGLICTKLLLYLNTFIRMFHVMNSRRFQIHKFTLIPSSAHAHTQTYTHASSFEYFHIYLLI